VNGEVGEVVVPAGSPESVMSTEPPNPFWPVTDAIKFEVEVPAVAVTVVGDTASVKSCAGLIVSVNGAEWVNDPSIPVAVTV
jgi:hypothetical protein